MNEVVNKRSIYIDVKCRYVHDMVKIKNKVIELKNC